MCVCMYVCMYVCVCVCVYLYIHVRVCLWERSVRSACHAHEHVKRRNMSKLYSSKREGFLDTLGTFLT